MAGERIEWKEGCRVVDAKRVCVCDDEAAIADLVGQLLRENGFEAHVCYTAPDALAAHAEHPFDLVILDIMMPGMDGFSCCRELRRQSAVPIIFLTAKDEEIDKVVGFELGADDYVVKPFKPRELMARDQGAHPPRLAAGERAFRVWRRATSPWTRRRSRPCSTASR